MRVRREVLGDDHVERATAAAGIDADFQRWLTEAAWGGLWARDAARPADPLVRHDRRAHRAARRARAARCTSAAGRRNGLSDAEIAEVIMHTAGYAGIPAANAAMAVAKQVLADPETGSEPVLPAERARSSRRTGAAARVGRRRAAPVRHPLVMITAMTRIRTVHACTDCGTGHPKWTGQCSGCGAWNTLVEEIPPTAEPARRRAAGDGRGQPAARHRRAARRSRSRRASPSSTACSAAASSPGRSRCSAASRASARARCCCSCSPGGRAPRSTSAPRRAPSRCACAPSGWRPCAPTCGWPTRRRWPASSTPSTARTPSLVVVDSIQTIADQRLGSSPGSVGQVRECAQQLVGEAKRRGVPIVLVGHVTKDGALAGPRVLEHVVDTVLSFEGERHHALRLLRAVKHRFGSTDELGLFEMTGTGLHGVPDPSKLFLADRRAAVAGSVVVPAMEGQRPLLVEVQALTVPVPPGVPARRNAQGLDGGRLALLLAVLERRAGAARRRPGRLRLRRRRRAARRAGRRPRRARRRRQRGRRPAGRGRRRRRSARSASAARSARSPTPAGASARRPGSGFRRAIVPASSPACDGIELVRVRTVAEALAAVGIGGPRRRPVGGAQVPLT